MFKEITLKNYRTHKKTKIELKPITLLIGNNNSGKTNLLKGVQHFSNLVKRARPDQNAYNPTVLATHYFPHKYRFADDDESMSIAIFWTNTKRKTDLHKGQRCVAPGGDVSYLMELYHNPELPEKTGCREKISCKLVSSDERKEVINGYDEETDRLTLRKKIGSDRSLDNHEKELCQAFFEDFAFTFSYDFQPSFLKGFAGEEARQAHQKKVRIPADLGYEGRDLQEILLHMKQHEKPVFARFAELLGDFDRGFQGIHHDPDEDSTIWEFEKTPNHLIDEFPSEAISDGVIKAAAISLLTSLQPPPALIMLEEIENGINPGNIQELMRWVWQAATPSQDGIFTQFILTSHSPSVLREFHEHLDHVYTFHLDKKRFKSDVRNLKDFLSTLISIGTLEGERDEENGNVIIPKYELTELWYSGAIG